MFRIPTIIFVIWFAIGAVAAWQRGYFDNDPNDCASAGTAVVTVLAGPLNYMGVNPKIHDCNVDKKDLPQPSK